MKVSEAIELLGNMPPDMEVDIVLLPGIKKPKKPKNGVPHWDQVPRYDYPQYIGPHFYPPNTITCKTVH